MNPVIKELVNNPAVLEIEKNGNHLGNLSLSEEALLYVTAFYKNPIKMCIVKQNAYTAQQLYERIQGLTDKKVLLFHVEENLQVEAIAASPELVANQVETLYELSKDEPCILVTSTAGAIRHLASPEYFQSQTIHCSIGKDMDLDQMKETLFRCGYEASARVDRPLTFASRGGIIDVFSINYELPIRIEFFDTEIESIRFFDIATQRTIETIQEVDIIPATPTLFSDEQIQSIKERVYQQLEKDKKSLTPIKQEVLSANIEEDMESLVNVYEDARRYRYYAYSDEHFGILDYCSDKIIFSSIEDIETNNQRMQEETILYLQELIQEQKALMKYGVFLSLDALRTKDNTMETHVFEQYKNAVRSNFLTLPQGDIGFDRTMDEIIEQSMDHRVFLALSKQQIKEVVAYLQAHDALYQMYVDTIETGITICESEMIEGCSCLDEKLYIYTGKEIFQTVPFVARYTNKFNEAEVLFDYMELEIGDYVVHNQYGIGMYMGIETKEVQGVKKDFLKIVYKGDDILFVPLEQFKLIRKFVSKEGARPRLHKLGSDQWRKTKEKVGASVANIAERLVNLYSMRETKIGFAFSKDNEMQKDFEEAFPYPLTIDQVQAVKEIKEDMESTKPMDRLLCGDVGFGKTEVAIRGAFKAVIDNKQVAFLCPTTILSNQHYKTFKKRFEGYPVNIEVLNRFVTPANQRRIIQDVKEGKVDILIGTHRILSKDISFKDLGFLVIDEEQRFGVEHKEKIKEFKNSVDVLSLSATPIPRTLQMSLIGVRSLSQLNTPPKNRVPVQTYVIERSMNFIKEVIQRELVRGGQVFYVYNNVKDIYTQAKKLQLELPDVNIGVAHGQMSREELENMMEGFITKEYDVLVCTTIVETGIDIPNANTIIIDQADRFGLSQLYQIKGRVGRSNRLAYAYLMYTPQKQLSEIAQKRLQSIKEFTQLGSGYKIAMRDLTIRGAGDMLGAQQAGFIDTVGIDLYIEMLHDAILEQQGKPKEVKTEVPISPIKIEAYVPKEFIPEDFETLTLYQKMDDIFDLTQLKEYYDSFIDNYGTPPKSIEMLFEKKRMDILLSQDYIESIKDRKESLELKFTKEWSASIEGVKLFEKMNMISNEIQLKYQSEMIVLVIPKYKNWLANIVEILELIKGGIFDATR